MSGGGQPVARVTDEAAVTWPAVSAAVGILTAGRARSGDSLPEIVGDRPPAQVLAALQVIGVVLLDALAPGDVGDQVLQRIGVAAAARADGGR